MKKVEIHIKGDSLLFLTDVILSVVSLGIMLLITYFFQAHLVWTILYIGMVVGIALFNISTSGFLRTIYYERNHKIEDDHTKEIKKILALAHISSASPVYYLSKVINQETYLLNQAYLMVIFLIIVLGLLEQDFPFLSACLWEMNIQKYTVF